MKRLWNWIHYRYALMHISKAPPKRKHSTGAQTKTGAERIRSDEERALYERNRIGRAWKL